MKLLVMFGELPGIESVDGLGGVCVGGRVV
jgi:hypothetical protein